jgi:hypothetical protein
VKKQVKKRKKRVLQHSFKIFTPNKNFNQPIILFEDITDININEIFGVVLYKDPSTKEWLLLFIKKNEDFLVIPIPDAVAWLLNDKVRSSVILMNSKFENIENTEGKILPFGREYPENND